MAPESPWAPIPDILLKLLYNECAFPLEPVIQQLHQDPVVAAVMQEFTGVEPRLGEFLYLVKIWYGPGQRIYIFVENDTIQLKRISKGSFYWETAPESHTKFCKLVENYDQAEYREREANRRFKRRRGTLARRIASEGL